MARLVIRIDNNGKTYTVSQMRKKLAQVLSQLDGSQPVLFNFVANLENYQPASPAEPTIGDPMGFQSAVMGELARPSND